MWFPLIPLTISLIISSSDGFWIENGDSKCPPKKELSPCTCTDSGEVTAVCKHVIDPIAIKDVFSKNQNSKIEKVRLDGCVLDYLPRSLLEYKNLKTLNISDTTLSSLFDEKPDHTPEMDIFMYNIRMIRGFEWELFKKSSITGLGIFNTEIRYFGRDFKEGMPEGIVNLWFENTRTVRITNQAFDRMKNIYLFLLSGGSIKKLARNMFPQPWNVKILSFNKQEITELPTDMFDEMPHLIAVSFIRNRLTTIDEKVFKKMGTTYSLSRNPINCSCDVKWITTRGKQSGIFFAGTCDGPDEQKGKNLRRLKEADFDFCQ